MRIYETLLTYRHNMTGVLRHKSHSYKAKKFECYIEVESLASAPLPSLQRGNIGRKLCRLPQSGLLLGFLLGLLLELLPEILPKLLVGGASQHVEGECGTPHVPTLGCGI